MTSNIFRSGLLVLLALMASQMFANSIYFVSLNTSTLPSSQGPYQLYLNLLDGNGTGDANNTVTLDTFVCTGIPSGCPTGVHSLTDFSFSTVTTFGFTAGGGVAFRVGLTGNLDDLAPDSFQLSILDGSGKSLPTTDPYDAVLFAQFDQSSPILQGYGSPNGAAITFSPPGIEPVPEPELGLPVSLALCLMLFLRQRLRRTTGYRPDPHGRPA